MWDWYIWFVCHVIWLHTTYNLTNQNKKTVAERCERGVYGSHIVNLISLVGNNTNGNKQTNHCQVYIETHLKTEWAINDQLHLLYLFTFSFPNIQSTWHFRSSLALLWFSFYFWFILDSHPVAGLIPSQFAFSFQLSCSRVCWGPNQDHLTQTLSGFWSTAEGDCCVFTCPMNHNEEENTPGLP